MGDGVDADAIVVGAGLAGLVAAAELRPFDLQAELVPVALVHGDHEDAVAEERQIGKLHRR